MAANTNLSANDRLYQEYEYEKRLKKRRAKLVCVTEEAFTHVKRVQHQHQQQQQQQQQQQNEYGSAATEPTIMNPYETAQAIFSTIARDLRRYLRVTRQQPYFTRDSILADLAQSISYDISPRAFLEKYIGGEVLAFNGRALANSYMQTTRQFGLPAPNATDKPKTDQNWILICENVLYQSVEDELMIVLKQNEVSLMCSFKRLPKFNLIEDILDPKRNKFLIKLNSETTV
jgi:vang-like